MCGRYFFQFDDNVPSWLQEQRQLQWLDFSQGEIFPTQPILALRQDREQPCLAVFTWGIKGYHGKLIINARSEGIDQKPSFRPWLNRRCAILANGFYEWWGIGREKAKYRISKQGEPLIYLAGIVNDQNECVIITGSAEHDLARIHTRTPIIMNEGQMRRYLAHRQDYYVDNEQLAIEKI